MLSKQALCDIKSLSLHLLYIYHILIWRWLRPLFRLGLKRSIQEEDIYEVTNHFRCEENTELLSQAWNEELKKKNPSIIRALFKLGGFKILLISIIYSVGDTAARYGVKNKFICVSFSIPLIFSIVFRFCCISQVLSTDLFGWFSCIFCSKWGALRFPKWSLLVCNGNCIFDCIHDTFNSSIYLLLYERGMSGQSRF